MSNNEHSFYIPVMGTGFTLDTPMHVARYGISSVVSLVDDVLMEKMRRHYCGLFSKPYLAIHKEEDDARARRITAFLDLTDDIVADQVAAMKKQPIRTGTEAYKYFDLLPESSPLKERFIQFLRMNDSSEKVALENSLLADIRPGAINTNIMTKVDKDKRLGNEVLSFEYSDASAALRGFALSKVSSGLVFSAGLNKRLFTYIEHFDSFFPDVRGVTKKEIIIKVSDYRSALIQGKILARRGIWVSEFRIESGLNCGGHAFATKGHLLGPVLQEFKTGRESLFNELLELYHKGLTGRDTPIPSKKPSLRVTVQGGISTSEEHHFLRKYYNLDSTGWGTPFLLVPEATSVDTQLLKLLAAAEEEDVVLSNASPLNVGFQNLRNSASETNRLRRIAENKPGSPCPKGYLAFNTEFGEQPVCTASRFYQKHKLEELKQQHLSAEEFSAASEKITDKACICHELGDAALSKHGLVSQENLSPAVCPGPNIAYFNREYSLAEMVHHIYGRIQLFEQKVHASLFATELRLYIQTLRQTVQKAIDDFGESELPAIKLFHENLTKGIEYYKAVLSDMSQFSEPYRTRFAGELKVYKGHLDDLIQQINDGFPERMAESPA